MKIHAVAIPFSKSHSRGVSIHSASDSPAPRVVVSGALADRGICGSAVALSFWNVWWACGLYVLIAVIWFIPDSRIELDVPSLASR